MIDRFAVIGSNSFSGSHFVSRLLAHGAEVLGLSRSPEVQGVFRPYEWQHLPGKWQFQQVDVNDSESVAAALSRFRPSAVINFAAQSMVAQSWDFPEHWYRTNVTGLATLVAFLAKLPTLEKYVHVTTPEVYGSTDGWITESENFHPTTPYAVSRAAGDMHLLAMCREKGFPVCFTRAANVYGPGQQLYRIVPRTLYSARLGQRLELDGGGSSTRSFVHISDVAEATLQVTLHGRIGDSYHISTDEILSIRELVLMICQLTGADFERLVVEVPERPGKDATYMLDSSKLKKELSWNAQVDLLSGLMDTLEWVDENLADFVSVPKSYLHKE